MKNTEVGAYKYIARTLHSNIHKARPNKSWDISRVREKPRSRFFPTLMSYRVREKTRSHFFPTLRYIHPECCLDSFGNKKHN